MIWPDIEFELNAQCSTGDASTVSVGLGTNIQDNSLVHVAKSNLGEKVLPTTIGDDVTIGHSAVLHGCIVEDETFIRSVRHFLMVSWLKSMDGCCWCACATKH